MPTDWLPPAPEFNDVAALAALVISLIAIWANRNAFRGKLLSDLLDEYATENMRVAMVEISECQDNPLRQLPDESKRRLVSHYFQKVHTLWKAGTVSKRFARHAISKDQAVRFLAMEPVERGINSNYDQGPFEFYAKLHGLPRTKR